MRQLLHSSADRGGADTAAVVPLGAGLGFVIGVFGRERNLEKKKKKRK